MTLEKNVETLRKLLVPKLAKIVEMMHEDHNPLLVEIPEDASLLSEDTISELIAKTNNNVSKAAEWLGAAYSAYKLTDHMNELTYKKSLRNEGKNEDERTAIAMQAAEEARERLALAEACFRYMAAIYAACEVNSQSARKLVDNYHSQRYAEGRDAAFGKPPAEAGRY